MNHWMIVTSPENFARTEALKFTVQGVKSRHRKKAERMQPGDPIVYYITGEATFAGICEITSPYFEAHESIWSSPGKPDEDYPWRVKIKKVVVPPTPAPIRAEDIKNDLVFVKKWPPEHWKLAFQGNVHFLPAEDFETIKSALAAGQPAKTRP
jgi:predicted RNA-binding protein